MYRRLLLPLTTITAIAVLLAVLSPTGATGAERRSSSDVFVFNDTARIEQPVNGNVQAYQATLVVLAPIAGDLLVIGGSVTFEGNGRVEGNLIHAASTLRDAEARVGGRVYPLASLEGAAGALTKNAIVTTLLLLWLISAVIVTLASGREIRASSMEVRVNALHCFVVGLVALTSFVITAIAFSYLVPYVVGIPLLAALGVFAALTKIYGMIVVFHALGTIVAGARNRSQLASRKWFRGDLAMVVLGVLLLGAIRMIPVVGTIVWGLASIFGVGTALATRFGRREPWFLEFKSAVA